MTTVGYGDRYPVTPAGRLIAMALMFCGVGLFGALSGIIASNFLGQHDRDEEVLAEIKALRAELVRRPGAGPPAD
jgi:voltage-gated potassium channel